MHLPHFFQDLFWDPLDAIMVSASLFLKFHLRPYLHYESLDLTQN